KVTVGQTPGHKRNLVSSGRGERLQPEPNVHVRCWGIWREVGSDIYDFHAEVRVILPVFKQNEPGLLLGVKFANRVLVDERTDGVRRNGSIPVYDDLLNLKAGKIDG